MAVGIAIGATFIANLIDANSLAEYRQNPKIVSSVMLEDDTSGNQVGWNPGINRIEYQEGGSTIIGDRARSEFKIIDDSVTKESMVYAVIVERHSIYPGAGASPKDGLLEVPCNVYHADGSFTVYCLKGSDPIYPREGTQLKYFVVSP